MKPQGGEHPLTVAVRVRPMTEHEILSGCTQVAHTVDNQMVVLLDPTEDPDDILRVNRSRERRYMFDHAFNDIADQEEVYQVTTRFLIDQVINGYNGTVFAYGATGAGKTYTMLGTQDNPGIYSRALNDLFLLVAKYEEENIYNVSMSYLEIYNEMVRDLLNPSSGYLEMREDAKGGVQVASLSEVSTASTEEIMELLQQGNMERTQEPTKANQTSSRSHAVLQVTVKQRTRARGINSQVKIGRLFLVDLAGSERAANTQNRGKRMVEGAHINRSLLALGNCITALSESSDKGARTYVNFRDSKLTRLLKDALGGNCKTVMIAHLGPASFHFEESRNTLMYADRAKRIKNKVRRNVEDVSYHIAQYTQIISELRSEIERLRAKVSMTVTRQPTSGIQAVQNEVLRSANDQEFFKQKEQLMLTFQEQMALRRKLMDLNNSSTEIESEISRQALLINDWESEQLKAKEMKEMVGSGDRELDKQLDLEGYSYDEIEPTNVKDAKAELQVLLSDKKKTDKLKMSVTKELEIARHKAKSVEENLPKYVSTELQKEILDLLLKIHEMEIQNIENTSQLYIKDSLISQKDIIIARYMDYKLIADHIISQQRALLQEQRDLVIPAELRDSYSLYQNQLQQIEEVHNDYRNILPPIKMSSIVNLTEMGSSSPNLDRLSTLAEETPSRFTSSFSRRNVNNRSSPDPQEDKFFSVSPRSYGVRSNGVMPHNLAVSPVKVKNKEDTIYTISMRSNSMESVDKRVFSPAVQSRGRNADTAVAPIVSQETRGIAALAAEKKRRQQQEMMSSRMNLQERTFVSTAPPYDDNVDRKLTPSRLASHNLTYGSRYNLNDDLDSYDNRSQNTDATPYRGRNLESSVVKDSRGQKSQKYRPQPLLRVLNNAAPLNSSNSDRLSDKTTDTSIKAVRHTKKAPAVSRGKQAAWKPQEPNRRAPGKPRTSKITSHYLKTLGNASLSETPPYKPVSKAGNDRRNGKGQGKTRPTIPSSYHKGDIAVSGFGLRY